MPVNLITILSIRKNESSYYRQNRITVCNNHFKGRIPLYFHMKRIVSLIVFTFLVVSCYQLVGQDFTFGAGGGIIIPSLVGGGSDNPTKAGNTFSIGNDFGVYGEYKIIDSYSCSVGLDYSSQGGLYKLKYLLVPFLVRQTWILEKHSKFYLGAGLLPDSYLIVTGQLTREW